MYLLLSYILNSLALIFLSKRTYIPLLVLSGKIKRSFFPSSGRVHATIWMHYIDADKAYREKAWRPLHKNATGYIEQILEAASKKITADVWLSISHL